MSILRDLGPAERIRRFEAMDADVGAFTTIDEAAVAESSSARTLAVKDNIDVFGLPTSDGIRALTRTVERDAVVVARARRAGVRVIGKTNLSELALGPITRNHDFGETRNPRNTARVSGGSSGGSAAALAIGLADFALGTDTGGSARNPASYCGVVGLRPTPGRLSMSGVSTVSTAFDTVCPMARSVDDLGWLMSGIDPLYRHSHVRKVRIGVPDRFFYDSADPDVAAGVEGVVHVLGDLATPTKIDLSFAAETLEPAGVLINAHAYTQIFDRLNPTVLDQMDRQVVERLMAGGGYSAAELADAELARIRWSYAVNQLWESVDLVLTPTTPSAAPRRDSPEKHQSVDINRFTRPWVLAPVPAISFPAASDRSALPFGAQLIGPPHSEELLLGTASAIQDRAAR